MQPVFKDPRVREYLLPTRVVWTTTGEAMPEGSDTLPLNGPHQCIFTGLPTCCRMRHQGEAPGIVLDFGREIHGGLLITRAGWGGTSEQDNRVRVRVRFGESVSEVMGTPNNDHAIHDFTITLPFCGSGEVGSTGFRFVRLDLIDEGAAIEITAVRAVTLMRDVPYLGTFRCNDERLNEIWQVGAHTVHLNMQDYLWDGAKRDRLVWIGDLHPETMVVNTVFGANDVVPRSLDLTRDTTPLPGWMNGIPAYSLWWLLIHQCWFQYQGDRAYLAEQREYLTALLRFLADNVDAQGAECMENGFRYIDWATAGQEETIHPGLQAMLLLGFDAGEQLCEVIGETETAELCRATAARMRDHLIPLPAGIKQPAALYALAGLAEAETINAKVLAQQPLQGLSPFFGYYVLQARAMAGDYQGCLDVIRAYWGGMLDMGATSFWESFDIAWMENAARIDELVPEGKIDIHAAYGEHCYQGLRHSLCHGWAGGPTAWLSEHVLGITPTEPGFAKVAIEPHLGDLTFAEGAFPTPYGLITVRHEKQPDGSVKSDIHLPDGILLAE